jgi:hypothetical protein
LCSGSIFGQAHDELFDFLGDTRASKCFARLAAVELLCYQSVVPTHEGLGCGEGGEVFEPLEAEWMGQRSKTSALGIGEPQASLTELSFENAIFLVERGDGVALVTSDPASDHGDEDVQDHGVPRVESSD